MLNRQPEPMTVAAFFAWQERQSERYELVGGVPVRMMAGARNVHDDIVVNLLAALHAALRDSGCRPFTGDGSVETLPGQIRRPDVGVDCGARDPDAMKAAEPTLVAEVLDLVAGEAILASSLEPHRRHSGAAERNPESTTWHDGEAEASASRVDSGFSPSASPGMTTSGFVGEQIPQSEVSRTETLSAKLAEYRTLDSLDHILLVEPNAPEIMHWSRDADRAWRKARVAGLDAALDLPGLRTRLALAAIYDGVSFPSGPRLVQDETPGTA